MPFTSSGLIASATAAASAAAASASTATTALAAQPVNQHSYHANTSTSASTTLATSDISGGSRKHTLNLTGAITSACNAQLPTAAALYTALSAATNWTYDLNIINGGGTGSGIWTITNASDASWTLTAVGMTVPVSTAIRQFVVKFTSPTAATLQAVDGK